MGRLFAENKSQGAYQQEHKNKLVRRLLCVALDLSFLIREHKNKELCDVVFFLVVTSLRCLVKALIPLLL